MEKIYSAKLLEDAKEQAYKDFEAEGADRDEVEITILEQPVKKLFGTKGEYKIKAEWKPVEVDVKSVFAASSEAVKETVAEEAPVSAAYTESAPNNTKPAETADENDPALTCAKIQRATAYLNSVLTKLGIADFTITPVKRG